MVVVLYPASVIAVRSPVPAYHSSFRTSSRQLFHETSTDTALPAQLHIE